MFFDYKYLYIYQCRKQTDTAHNFQIELKCLDFILINVCLRFIRYFFKIFKLELVISISYLC